MVKDDGYVLHFANPKVQASLTANTFAVTGNCEEKRKFFVSCQSIIPLTHTPSSLQLLLRCSLVCSIN